MEMGIQLARDRSHASKELAVIHYIIRDSFTKNQVVSEGKVDL